MIDIIGKSTDPRAANLSNFKPRRFDFDGVQCAGLEGPLQAFKCPDKQVQLEICKLSGKEAKAAGQRYDTWKQNQLLWWLGRAYPRSDRSYPALVTFIYDAAFAQDPSFAQDLLLTGNEELRHSIGNPDMRDTVLTEMEMICQLYRLRARAQREAAR